MPLTREKKKQVVGEVENIFKTSGSVVFVQFAGVSVKETEAMRKDLATKDVFYKVVKKSLVEKAASSVGLESPFDFKGEMAVVYSEDQLSASREILAYQKQFKNRIEIRGGIFENKVKSESEMNEIATIPSKTELIGMFVNLINSPIQRFAIALDKIAEQKINVKKL